MSSAPIDVARDLFNDALELQPAARSEFLDRACKDDPALRAEVERLLRAFKRAGEFLEPDTTHRDSVGEDDFASLIGRRVGAYAISRVIGAGGMGVVYEAQQERPTRTVALKLMRRGVASRSALRRFEHESEILARLQHPGIAQVYDVGMHDDGSGGVPYFVMEFIAEARTLTDYARSENLGARQRLELFINICDAVHHGHQKGVIHRDLKPGNILIDASGQPKIIDFGVARATDSDIAVTTMQTDVGQLIGTLQYMSPEQIEADPHDLDIRSDVYALGVVLYELLCGKPPYDVSQARIFEATRIIREDSPTRPSTVDRALRGDLETIVLKALEKERERRYQSAADLGADIHRYLTRQTIMARPASTAYQLRTFARRNKALVGGVAATFVVLVAGLIGISAMFLRARTAETNAELRADELAREMAFKDSQFTLLETALLLQSAERRPGTTASLRDILEERRKRLGDTHPHTLGSIQILGRYLFTLDRFVEAESYLQEALTGYREVLGEDDPRTIQCMAQTGAVLRELGRLDEAEQLCAEAAERARIVLRNRPGVVEVVSMGSVVAQHGYTLMVMERFEEAEAAYLEKYAILEPLDPAHHRVQQTAGQMVRLYNRWHAAEPDEGHDVQAAEWRAKLTSSSNDDE